jgi:dihydroneopterin aldolase/2-amino-4-hydroxy-6-hydroxymethyldihydropteridine diphosphokinase
MALAFVSVGSNIDPENNVRKAVRLLGIEVHIQALSTVYLTEPIGRPDQPFYYNCVISIETPLPPLQLKSTVLQRIENALGRTRNDDNFAPRTIDLDLILYDNIRMATKELTLPDPDILQRAFLAVALHELAPDLILPGTTVRIADAAAELPRKTMKPLEPFTDLLRREIHHGSEH